MKRLLVAASLAAAAASVPAQAATLVISGGQLMGAQGVTFGGSTYDVSFLDGTCVAMFSGCNDVGDFDLGGSAGRALQAANALDSQVFQGVFDSAPQRTNGCVSTSLCRVLIPYAPGPASNMYRTAAINNYPGGAFDPKYTNLTATRTIDLRGRPEIVFARFTETGNLGAVPEPTTWAMMVLGMAGIGGAMRRRGNLRQKVHFAR